MQHDNIRASHIDYLRDADPDLHHRKTRGETVMANIYFIRKELEAFEFEIDPETGELLNAPEWDALNMAYEEKVENIACYIKNLVSDVADFKAEENSLAQRRKATERKVEFLKRLLLDNMNGQKFSTVKCAVSFRRSEAVQVDDVTHIPAELLRVKTSVEPDKTAIKAALKDGQEVSGCKLVENVSVQVK